MRYLTVSEVLRIHDGVLKTSGGGQGIRSLGGIQAAVGQPKATFGGADLYETIVEKGAALCFGLVLGHGFVDGNKRVGHAALEVFLLMNGYELIADVDEQEAFFLGLAAGDRTREELVSWLELRAIAQ